MRGGHRKRKGYLPDWALAGLPTVVGIDVLTCLCTHVFSPFSAHFYPPLHHNGKGSIGIHQTAGSAIDWLAHAVSNSWSGIACSNLCKLNRTSLFCAGYGKAMWNSVEPH